MGATRVDHEGATHVGRVRTLNEDSWRALPDAGVFVVADGMGGHRRGDWASAQIVEMIEAADLPHDFDAACERLAAVLHQANTRVFAEGERAGEQTGSTVVALLMRDRRFAALWVGDSRAYVSRGGMLYRLTHDHTQVQAMLDRGLISDADAATHPMRHVLARAVGVQPTLEVDVIRDEIEPGDVFLLCSDGLTARVADAEIAAALARSGPCARELIDLTLERGAPDNVTVVAVVPREPTSLTFRPVS
ncbi:PP2C family protein-serine/threonine phosphatase [Sphingomonas sp. MMS24-JH45]